MDPKARRDFWEEIHQLAGQGLTFLITTHYMDEAERCHRLAYILNGKLLTHGTVAEVIAHAHLTTWAVSGPRPARTGRAAPRPARRATGRGLRQPSCTSAATTPRRWNRRSRRSARPNTSGGEIESGLEDVFIHLMDNGSRKGGAMRLATVFSLARFWAMVVKEFVQMRRDRLTFGMMIGIPLMQLILFGFAINSDPKHLPAAVLVADHGPHGRTLLYAHSQQRLLTISSAK